MVEWAGRLMMDHNTTQVCIDDTGLGNWNLRRTDESASTTEKEVDTSHTGKGVEVEEGSTQGDGGDGDSKQISNKKQEQRGTAIPKEGDGKKEPLLDPIRDLKMKGAKLWREMDYTHKKIHLIGGPPGFLKQHVSLEKVQNAIHRLAELTASDFLRTLEPANFKMFLNQLGVPEKIFRYGRDSHGSNVEYTMRIKIKSIGKNGLPGKPEHALGGF